MWKRLSLLLLVAALGARAEQLVVFATPFSSITTSQSSSPIQNVGQCMHVLVAEFLAEASTVSGFQVRLEASYDNLTFFPISADISEAPLLGGKVYGVEVAYGVFPFLRLRSVLATPGGKLMTVRYNGHLLPVVPASARLSDRWAF